MYVEVVKNRNSPPAILVRESYREDGKVKKRTVANISNLPPDVVLAIKAVLKNGGQPLQSPGFKILRSLPHGHVAACLHVLADLGLDRAISSKTSRSRELIIAMIVMRIVNPCSKLDTARRLHSDTATSSLGELLGLGHVDENELYRAMGDLLKAQPRIEKKLARKHLAEGGTVLYDLTSTWYEGTTCPLAARGHSRDGKKGTLQINFGLLTDTDGRPVSVEVHAGNTADPATVPGRVEALRGRFGLDRVILVGDRGMLTSARIREDLEPHDNIGWISALRGPQIRKLAAGGDIQMELFDERDLAEITSGEFPGERLVACRNPSLATRRAATREDLLAATEAKLETIARAVSREKRPYQGTDKIARRVEREAGAYKMLKHFTLHIADESLTWTRNEDSIAEEAATDGIYIIRAGRVPEEDLDARGLVLRYKDLSRVEQAFRSMKTVSLKVRPIFHSDEDMVRAHIFLCMLAYYVEWEMMRRLAPVLFKDDDPEAAAAARDSGVAPATRSPAAKAKAASKRTPNGQTVHSFSSAMALLSTVCRNTVGPALHVKETFTVDTSYTPEQRHMAELLGMKV